MPLVAHHGVTPRVHPSAFVAEGAVLVGEVSVGPQASIWYNAVLRGDINAVEVGERTNVQDGAVLHVTHECAVRVGNDVTIGHQALVHGCVVGDGALIGMGAVVLDNARVGPRSLVAAGAVVLEGFVVPEGMLAAGVPARVIRRLTEEEQRGLLQSAQHYVEYAQSSRG